MSGNDPSGGRLDRVEGPFTPRTPRIVAARRLQRRRDREQAGRFLAEGPQAVREALGTAPPPGVPASGVPASGMAGGGGAVHEVFGTGAALRRHADLVDAATTRGVPVSEVTEDALAALAETVQPQGVVAVCAHLHVPLADAVRRGPRLVAVLAEIRDPGNAGTVLRTADAAGAGAVVFAGDAVDPYNGKCVRASAGSLFHVDVVRDDRPEAVVTALRGAGVRVLAATGHGDADLDELADTGELAGPTAWLFGSEAHGLPKHLLSAADLRVRVPMHGRAESLNLAAAAAVCLYASARAQRNAPTEEPVR